MFAGTPGDIVSQVHELTAAGATRVEFGTHPTAETPRQAFACWAGLLCLVCASLIERFQLFDLRSTVEAIRGVCTCGHQIGDSFALHGGQLSLPGTNRSFCLYALQSALPLLPAKQRPLQPADWMKTDTHMVCPDHSVVW